MLISFLSCCIILSIAILLRNKQALPSYKRVIIALCMQMFLFYAILNIKVVVDCIKVIVDAVESIGKATAVGTAALFGYIGGNNVVPFEVKNPNGMFILAFQALANVILVGGLAAILTYTRILPIVSKLIGKIFRMIFGVNDSVGMYSATQIFFGQMDSILLVKQGAQSFNRHELMTTMCMAFTTSSAAVMPTYSSIISNICPDAMTYIVSANILNVFSTLILCMILTPFSNDGNTDYHNPYDGFISAMTTGINDGANVWRGIVCTLLGMTALVAFGDNILHCIHHDLTIKKILGWIVYPFTYLLDSIPHQDRFFVAQILGSKIALNEFIAFQDLSASALSQKSVKTLIYLINNFGNFAAIGITVSCFSAIIPSKKKEITEVAVKAFVVGLLATFMTASLVCIFI